MIFLKTQIYKLYVLSQKLLLLLRIALRLLPMAVLRRTAVVMIATPRHGNLGDHAIVETQYAFFADMGLASHIIELSKEQYLFVRDALQKLLPKNAVIVIDGGGNIGTLWLTEEQKMRDVMTRFPQNPIFIFPQTAFFEDSEQGRAELETSVRVYSSHADLTVFCRDKATCDLFCQAFPQVRALYVPDIVLYRSHEMHLPRGGRVLLCMRTDREQTAESRTAQDAVRVCLEKAGVPFEYCSTVADHDIDHKERAGELQAFFEKLSGARFVVTDRLHGMLFCAVTGTPCIALDNVSRKVSGGFAWVRHLPYIRLCGDLSSAVQATEDYIRQTPEETVFDNAPLEPYYEKMRELVREKLRRKNG